MSHPLQRPTWLPSLIASSGFHVTVFLALLALGVVPFALYGGSDSPHSTQVAFIPPAPPPESQPVPPEETETPLEITEPDITPVVKELETPPEPIVDPTFRPVDLDPSPLEGILTVVPFPPDPVPETEAPPPTPPQVPESLPPESHTPESLPQGEDSPDEAPFPLAPHCPGPRYPLRAIQQGWEGSVVCRMTVGVDGFVTQVALQESSGHKILDRAVLACLKTWRFRPGRRAGVPATMDVDKRIEFRL